jgi:hypothetical protein
LLSYVSGQVNLSLSLSLPWFAKVRGKESREQRASEREGERGKEQCIRFTVFNKSLNRTVAVAQKCKINALFRRLVRM